MPPKLFQNGMVLSYMNSVGFAEGFCSLLIEFTWKAQVFHLKNTPELNPSKRYRVLAEGDEELDIMYVPHKSRIFREFLA